MSEMSTDLKVLPKPIKGAGLTNAGVVVLQFLLILLVETLEYSIGKAGIFTGVAILAAVAGGFYLGRPGTDFATIVNPPITFFITSVILVATVGGAGLHVTKFGVELVTTLGAVAPYLGVATLAGWGWYIYNHINAKRVNEKASNPKEDDRKVLEEEVEIDPITTEAIED
jgi:hypothetical protein